MGFDEQCSDIIDVHRSLTREIRRALFELPPQPMYLPAHKTERSVSG